MEKYIKISILEYLSLVAFVFGVISICGYNFFDPSTFARWDSNLYTSISKEGYYIFKDISSDGVTIFNGNCGWFPLYPFIIYLLNAVFGVSYNLAGCIISFFCTFLIIVIINKQCYITLAHNKVKNLFVILLFPGFIYLFTVFPMSLTLLFILLNIICLNKKKYLIAGIWGLLASMSYSTAFLICVIDFLVVFYDWIVEREYKLGKLFKNAILSSGISFLGFIFTNIIMAIATGEIGAFFLTQAKYGHGIHNPVITLVLLIIGGIGESIGYLLISLLSLVVFLYMLVIIYLFIKKKWWRKREKVVYFTVAVVFYGFLLIMGIGVSPLRQYLLMAPSILILKDESKKMNIILLIIFLLMAPINIYLFVANISV